MDFHREFHPFKPLPGHSAGLVPTGRRRGSNLRGGASRLESCRRAQKEAGYEGKRKKAKEAGPFPVYLVKRPYRRWSKIGEAKERHEQVGQEYDEGQG
jgi:hypothetical protein